MYEPKDGITSLVNVYSICVLYYSAWTECDDWILLTAVRSSVSITLSSILFFLLVSSWWLMALIILIFMIMIIWLMATSLSCLNNASASCFCFCFCSLWWFPQGYFFIVCSFSSRYAILNLDIYCSDWMPFVWEYLFLIMNEWNCNCIQSTEGPNAKTFLKMS